MKKLQCLLGRALFITLAFSSSDLVLAGDAQDAHQFVRKNIDDILVVLHKSKDDIAKNDCQAVVSKLRNVLADKICIDTITNFITPKSLLDKASVAERKNYNNAIASYLIGSYSSAFGEVTDKLTVKVLPVRGNANSSATVQVKTLILLDPKSNDRNSQVPVNVIVQKSGESWCLADFVINDSVDQLLSMRDQVKGMPVNDLSALTAKIEAHNSAQCKKG